MLNPERNQDHAAPGGAAPEKEKKGITRKKFLEAFGIGGAVAYVAARAGSRQGRDGLRAVFGNEMSEDAYNFLRQHYVTLQSRLNAFKQAERDGQIAAVGEAGMRLLDAYNNLKNNEVLRKFEGERAKQLDREFGPLWQECSNRIPADLR